MTGAVRSSVEASHAFIPSPRRSRSTDRKAPAGRGTFGSSCADAASRRPHREPRPARQDRPPRRASGSRTQPGTGLRLAARDDARRFRPDPARRRDRPDHGATAAAKAADPDAPRCGDRLADHRGQDAACGNGQAGFRASTGGDQRRDARRPARHRRLCPGSGAAASCDAGARDPAAGRQSAEPSRDLPHSALAASVHRGARRALHAHPRPPAAPDARRRRGHDADRSRKWFAGGSVRHRRHAGRSRRDRHGRA